MAGVILETLSTKKLIAFAVVAFLCQVVCFLVGGLAAPSPYNVQQLLSTNCVDKNRMPHKWFEPWGDHSCAQVQLKDRKVFEEFIDANQIVFAVRFPLRRDDIQLDMSRWHQNLVAVVHIEVDHDSELTVADLADMTIDARLGYQDRGQKDNSTWTEIVRSKETRQLKCSTGLSTVLEDHGPIYHCDMLPLFELGSCHYDYYLINLRLPVDENGTFNANLPKIESLSVVVIHPNGGFTKVWVSMKTVMCPFIIAALVWHIYRVKQQERGFNLLERTLVSLGTAMSLLNLPIEYFTLWLYMPYMLLYSDIRQGIFYSVLLCFWIIFAGEHLMDQVERNRLVIYWKHLSAVAFGCICLFVFEMCERGVQLVNPFFSIWATPYGSNMALGFIILAGISACVYFFFLLYMIVQVFRNITSKKSSLPQMSKARKRFYMGLIYRFNFLMSFTLICAAATVIFFIIGQVSEGSWKWDAHAKLEYTSAFLTGVYGMWNIYVLSLLILYAPSTKTVAGASDASEDEAIEFAHLPSEASALTTLAQKAEQD